MEWAMTTPTYHCRVKRWSLSCWFVVRRGPLAEYHSSKGKHRESLTKQTLTTEQIALDQTQQPEHQISVQHRAATMSQESLSVQQHLERRAWPILWVQNMLSMGNQ